MNKRILVLDTETTGLPPRSITYRVTKAWKNCRLVQIAWKIYDASGSPIEPTECYIVKPDDFTIPEVAANIHGITTECAEKEGIDIQIVLTKFEEALKTVDLLVAHNMAFDKSIILSELYRYKMKDAVKQMEEISTECTMLMATKPYEKWPKLTELYAKCFGETPAISHRADADMEQCGRIYFHLIAN